MIGPAADSAPTAVLDSQATMLAERAMTHPASVAVAVLGSVARYEAAWARIDGRVEPFSDLELLLVTSRRLRPNEQLELRDALAALATTFGYVNPLFHVELLCRERRSLARMPPYIFTFELVANARTLAGPPILDKVRRVGLENLDRRNSHEILMKRLWALAEGLPQHWLADLPLDHISALVLAANLARQPLDVTTVLLPEVGILRPTYRQRLETWSHTVDLPCRSAIDQAAGGDSSEFLAGCLERRRDLRPLSRPTVEYERVVRVLEAALGWLLRCEPSTLPQALPERSRQLFHEWPVTRGEWLALARQSLEIAARLGPAQATRWLFAPRKGLLAASLLELHLALIAHQQGDVGSARAHLDRGASLVAGIDDSGLLAGGIQASWAADGVSFFRRETGALADSPRYSGRETGALANSQHYSGRETGSPADGLRYSDRETGSPGDSGRQAGGQGCSDDEAGSAAGSRVYFDEAGSAAGYQAGYGLPSGDFLASWCRLRAAIGWQFWRTVRLGDPSAWASMASRIAWPTADRR